MFELSFMLVYDYYECLVWVALVVVLFRWGRVMGVLCWVGLDCCFVV